MKLPYARNISSATKKYTLRFGGINSSDVFEEGEFEDMENLSTERFPYLSVRKPYNVGKVSLEEGRKLNKIWGDGNILAVTSTSDSEADIHTYINFRNYDETNVPIPDLDAMSLRDDLSMGKLDFVRINNKLTVFTDCGNLPNSSNLISPYTINLDPDLVELDPELTEYAWESTTCIAWGSASLLPNRLILHEGTIIGGRGGVSNFHEGDTVAIYWAKGEYDGENTYWGSPDFYGVLSSRVSTVAGVTEFGFTSNIFENLEPHSLWVKIERKTPENLCFPIGINNRIWAVKDNTVFASALGDPCSWESFEGLASDSYRVSVDSSGSFTGVSVYDSNPIFFKENTIYRLYGTLPSNFSLQKTDAPGVMKNCSESIQKINEVLYYKGIKGVYRYSGGIPECISHDLGDLSAFDTAVAGSDDRYYYLTMSEKGEPACGSRLLYVYDTQTGIWLKDENKSFNNFAHWGNVLYMSNGSGELFSRRLDTEKGLTETDNNASVSWYAEFKPFTETVNEKKVYSKLHLRLELEEGAYVTVYVKHDNGTFNEITTLKANTEKSVVSLPIKLKKCDSFTLRLEGHKGCTIKSVTREYRTAGER